jgi:hypothetical protein
MIPTKNTVWCGPCQGRPCSSSPDRRIRDCRTPIGSSQVISRPDSPRARTACPFDVRRDEAHALLTPVYGWFTEGFDKFGSDHRSSQRSESAEVCESGQAVPDTCGSTPEGPLLH